VSEPSEMKPNLHNTTVLTKSELSCGWLEKASVVEISSKCPTWDLKGI